jgi:hypothetical protein
MVGNRGRLCGGPLLHALLRLQRSRWRPATYQPTAAAVRLRGRTKAGDGVVALLLGECRTEGEAADVAPRREVRFPRAPGLIPNPLDQNPWAHCRSPMDMILQG